MQIRIYVFILFASRSVHAFALHYDFKPPIRRHIYICYNHTAYRYNTLVWFMFLSTNAILEIDCRRESVAAISKHALICCLYGVLFKFKIPTQQPSRVLIDLTKHNSLSTYPCVMHTRVLTPRSYFANYICCHVSICKNHHGHFVWFGGIFDVMCLLMLIF